MVTILSDALSEPIRDFGQFDFGAVLGHAVSMNAIFGTSEASI